MRSFSCFVLFIAASTCLLGIAQGLPGEAVDQTTRTALALDVHVAVGNSLFVRRCARCHGQRGYGSANGIPALAGQRYAYIVRQLANFAADEREGAAMRHVLRKGNLENPQAWADVAGYLSRLRSSPKPQTGDGTHVALGRGIFHEQCSGCHQADGAGDTDGLTPSLRGQGYPYLVSEIKRLAKGSRHSMDEDLVRFIGSFDARDIDGLADYLSRLQAPTRPRERMRPDGTVIDEPESDRNR